MNFEKESNTFETGIYLSPVGLYLQSLIRWLTSLSFKNELRKFEANSKKWILDKIFSHARENPKVYDKNEGLEFFEKIRLQFHDSLSEEEWARFRARIQFIYDHYNGDNALSIDGVDNNLSHVFVIHQRGHGYLDAGGVSPEASRLIENSIQDNGGVIGERTYQIDSLLTQLVTMLPPFVVAVIEHKDPFESSCEKRHGLIVCAPWDLHAAHELNNLANPKALIKIIELAKQVQALPKFLEQLNVQIVGLGAYFPILTNFGKRLIPEKDNERIDLETTTGHSMTLALMIRIFRDLTELCVKEKGVQIANQTHAIVGCGAIGISLAHSLLQFSRDDSLNGDKITLPKEIVLYDINYSKAKALNRKLIELCAIYHIKNLKISVFSPSGDIQKDLQSISQEANVMAMAATAKKPIDTSVLNPNCLIVDDSQPALAGLPTEESGVSLSWVAAQISAEHYRRLAVANKSDGVPYLSNLYDYGPNGLANVDSLDGITSTGAFGCETEVWQVFLRKMDSLQDRALPNHVLDAYKLLNELIQKGVMTVDPAVRQCYGKIRA